MNGLNSEVTVTDSDLTKLFHLLNNLRPAWALWHPAGSSSSSSGTQEAAAAAATEAPRLVLPVSPSSVKDILA